MKKHLIPLILAALATFNSTAHAEECQKKYPNGQESEYAAKEAIQNHDLFCLKEYLSKGVEFKDADGGYLSWENVVRWGDLEIANYVFSLGIRIREMQKNGEYVSNVHSDAALSGSLDMVKFLDSKGFRFELPINEWKESYRSAKNHFTPNCSPMLHVATHEIHADIVRFLVSKGVDVNARCGDRAILYNNDGFPTPLLLLSHSYEAWSTVESFRASVERRTEANEVLKALIDAGGDLSARDDYSGKTAYQLLLETKWITPAMAEYLKARIK